MRKEEKIIFGILLILPILSLWLWIATGNSIYFLSICLVVGVIAICWQLEELKN